MPASRTTGTCCVPAVIIRCWLIRWTSCSSAARSANIRKGWREGDGPWTSWVQDRQPCSREPTSGASRGRVSSREPTKGSRRRASPRHPPRGHGPPPSSRGELDTELRRGSQDREATSGSAWSPTLIIPTKAFWTNSRYDGQGARAEVGGLLVVRRRAGLRQSTHRWLPTSILRCSKRAARTVRVPGSGEGDRTAGLARTIEIVAKRRPASASDKACSAVRAITDGESAEWRKTFVCEASSSARIGSPPRQCEAGGTREVARRSRVVVHAFDWPVSSCAQGVADQVSYEPTFGRS